MAKAAYHAVLDFKVSRRMTWEGDFPALERHLDEVCEQLDGNNAIEQYRLGGDMSNALLHLEVIVVAESPDDAESMARAEVSDAINEAGAAHEGLLTLREESQAKAKVNAWAGLRTPKWQSRTVKVKLAGT